eukprot:m.61945 g.61945  ORF g.61945 m.61945 type:complete len:3627 (-) comp11888_c0_seq2:204-11084(-)
MFEGLLVSTLKEHLGPFLEGFDEDQLSLGVWKGQLKFLDLKLKSTILADLDVPVQLHKGYIGSLQLDIPWKQLFPTPSKPVKAHIDSLFVIVGPHLDQPFKKEAHEKNVAASKASALAAFEADFKEKTKSDSEKKKSASFTEKLVASIVNNLQITIGSIHIRYEDSASHPGHPFAVGCTLHELTAETTDAHFRPQFTSGMPPIVYKRVDISSFALYLKPDAVIFHKEKDWVERMRACIHTTSNFRETDLSQFLLQPVDLSINLALNAKGEVNQAPKADADINITKFQLSLSRQQYSDLLFLGDGMSRFARQSESRDLRPATRHIIAAPGQTKNTRDWWLYAYNAIARDIRQKREVWDWSFMQKRRAMRLRYIDEYRKFCAMTKPRDIEKATKSLAELEKDYSKEDLLDYRGRVRDQMLADAKAAAAEQQDKAKKKKKEGGGWFSSWFSSSESKVEQEQQALYEAIGYTEDDLTGVESTNKSYVAIQAQLSILMMGVSLSMGSVQQQPGDEEPNHFFDLKLSDLGVTFQQRPAAEAMKAVVGIQSLSLADETASSEDRRLIVEPRRIIHHRGQRDAGVGRGTQKLLSLVFETNPEDMKVDSRVHLDTAALQIQYVPSFVDEIVRFVSMPDELAALEDVAQAALDSASTLSSQTATGLMHAIETHQTLDLHVELGAPTLLIPTQSALIVVDLGHLSVKSDFSHMDEVCLTNVDAGMYDVFHINLSHTQVLVLPCTNFKSSESWLAITASSEPSNFHLLSPFSINIDVMQCVQQNNPDYARMKFTGSLPDMELLITDSLYKTLMQFLVELLPPKTEEQRIQELGEGVGSKKSTKPVKEKGTPQKKQGKRRRRRKCTASTTSGGPTAVTGSPNSSMVSSASSIYLTPHAHASRMLVPGIGGMYARPASPHSVPSSLGQSSEDEFLSCEEGDTDIEEESEPPGPSTLAEAKVQTTSQLSEEELEVRAATHVQVTGSFSIGRIAVKIATSANADLADILCVELLQVELSEFIQRQDMSVKLSLGAVNVLDYITKGYFLQSNPPDSLPSIDYNNTSDALISIAYKACPEDSILLEDHNNKLSTIEASMGDLRINVTQESVYKLMHWVNTTLAFVPTPPKMSDEASSATSTPTASSVLEGSQAADVEVVDFDFAAAAARAERQGNVSTMSLKQSVEGVNATAEASDDGSLAAAHDDLLPVTDMAVSASISSLQVVLCSKQQPLASLLVAGANAKVSMAESGMEVAFELSRIELADLLQEEAAFKQVLSVQGSRVLNLKVNMWSESEQARRAVNAADVEIELMLEPLKFVVVPRFLQDLATFGGCLMPPVAPTVPSLPHGAGLKATGDTLASPTGSIFMNPSHAPSSVDASKPAKIPKLGLDVNLKAPNVFVPIGGTSSQLIYLDLGRLTCVNKLSMWSPQASSSGEYLVDIMKVKLSDVCLSLVEASNLSHSKVPSSSKIIPSILIEADVKRSLDPSHHLLPDNDVTCNIRKIEVNLTTADYSTLMSIVEGSLKEKPLWQSPVTDEYLASDQSSGMATESASTEGTKDNAVGPGDAQNGVAALGSAQGGLKVAEARPRSVSMAVQSAVDSALVVKTYTATVANVQLAALTLSLFKTKEEPLGAVSIKGLGVKATIDSDGATHVLLDVNAFEVEDIRKDSRSHYRKLLKYNEYRAMQTTHTSRKRFLSVNAKMVESTTAIVINLVGVDIDLCMDFVTSLLSFLPEATPSNTPAEDQKGDTQALDGPAHSHATSVDDFMLEDEEDEEAGSARMATTSAGATVFQEQEAEEEPDESRMTVHIMIAEPCITVVANPDDPLSRALRMTFQTNVHYSQNMYQQNASVFVTDMQLASLRPYEDRREFVTILQPCTLSLNYSLTQATKLTVVQVRLDSVDVVVGYNDIQAVTTVLGALSSNTEPDSEDESTPALMYESRMEHVDEGRWYARDDVRKQADELSMLSVESSMSTQRSMKNRWQPELLVPRPDHSSWIDCSSAEIEIEAINIELIDDYKQQDTPLLLLSSTLLVQVKNLLSDDPLHVWLTLQLVASYYNPRVSNWEPLLEPLINSSMRPEIWELEAYIGLQQGKEAKPYVSATESQQLALNALPDTNHHSEDAAADAAPPVLHDVGDEIPSMLIVANAAKRLELTFSTALYEALMTSVFVAGEEARDKQLGVSHGADDDDDDDNDHVSDAVLLALRAAPSSRVAEITVPHEESSESHAMSPQVSPNENLVTVQRQFVGYVLVNETGHTATVMAFNGESFGQSQAVDMGEAVPLVFAEDKGKHSTQNKTQLRALAFQATNHKRIIAIDIDGCELIQNVEVQRVGRFAFRTCVLRSSHPVWVTVEVRMRNAIKVVTVRSCLRLKNSLNIPLQVAAKTHAGYQVLPTVEPGKEFSLPLIVAYTGFVVKPSGLSYNWCSEVIKYGTSSTMVLCQPQFDSVMDSQKVLQQENEPPLALHMMVLEEVYENTRPTTGHPRHLIQFAPRLVLRNVLPCRVSLQLFAGDGDLNNSVIHLAPGQRFPVIASLTKRVTARFACDWNGYCMGTEPIGEDDETDEDVVDKQEAEIISNLPWSDEILLFKPSQRRGRRSENAAVPGTEFGSLYLSVECQSGPMPGCVTASIFCPYWVVNHTGQTLVYRQRNDDVGGPSYRVHKPDQSHPMLLSRGKLGPVAARKFRIGLPGPSQMSDPISLDTVGAPFDVTFPNKHGVEQKVSVTVSATSDGLTKIVTLDAGYLLHNATKQPLLVAEAGKPLEPSMFDQSPAHVTRLEPGACSPFWPEFDACEVRVIGVGWKQATDAFSVQSANNYTLLVPTERKNLFHATKVAVRLKESVMVATLSAFTSQVDVRIENRCRHFDIEYRQAGVRESAFQCLDISNETNFVRPICSGENALEWRVGGGSFAAVTHTLGSFYIETHHAKGRNGADERVWAVSFPDGPQPVLLFVDDARFARELKRICGLHSNALTAEELKPPALHNIGMYFAFTLTGFGLSLVDAKPREVAYISLNPKLAWEFKLDQETGWGEDWQRLPIGQEEKLNAAVASGNVSEPLALTSTMKADLQGMMLFVDDNPPVCIRQKSNPGVGVTYVDCERLSVTRLVVENIQIDNQSPDADDALVLTTVEPDVSVLPTRSVIKFMAVQTKQLGQNSSDIMMLDRVSFLMQKLDAYVTIPFLMRLAGVFTFGEPGPGVLEQSAKVHGDQQWAVKSRTQAAVCEAGAAGAAFVSCRLFQLHPLCLQLTFKATADDEADLTEEEAAELDSFGDTLIGAILAPVLNVASVTDATLKLSALELNNVFAAQDELVADIVAHYTKEGIRQAYKVLLGLDFVGNPGQLFGHLTTGMTHLYYEPLHEGLTSLASNAVVGATGMVSGLTGALGNTMAAITMDKDFQRQRRQAQSRKKTTGQHVLHTGESMLRSVWGGATGLFVKPIEGARSGGALGFMKGVGMGVVGLVAKPIVGVIDMTTNTVDLLSQIAGGGDAAARVRPPRAVRPDNVLRPFSTHHAVGSSVLHEMKLRFKPVKWDMYMMHLPLRTSKGDQIVTITNKSVVLARMDAPTTPLCRVAFRRIQYRRVISGKGYEIGYLDMGPLQGEGSKKSSRKSKKLLLESTNPELVDLLAAEISLVRLRSTTHWRNTADVVFEFDQG